MTIARPATPADIPAITRIYAESVLHGTASFELTPPDEAEMARRMRELTETGFPYLAAEANGELAGYAYAALYRTRPAYRWTVEDSVYISPAHQRGGVGRALLTALIEACTQRGFRQMIAVIGDSPNQAGSVGLHRALGFAHVGIVHDVGFKHGHWRDTLLMQRVLGEGGTTKPRSS
ncbi:MAG TPA: GNAT family N-acetyltransferase [Pseudolabrys sp.]|nr:GNAT family N-acetyltransferase [Pseudolabrys sp.]